MKRNPEPKLRRNESKIIVHEGLHVSQNSYFRARNREAAARTRANIKTQYDSMARDLHLVREELEMKLNALSFVESLLLSYESAISGSEKN